MKAVMYFVPAKIAKDLGLTAIRHSDGKGSYLLSQSDLRSYGIDRALREGASPVTKEESKVLFNL